MVSSSVFQIIIFNHNLEVSLHAQSDSFDETIALAMATKSVVDAIAFMIRVTASFFFLSSVCLWAKERGCNVHHSGRYESEIPWESMVQKVPGTTPNMDRLAKEGLRFEHGHVSTIAICQPTRAVLMTGRYPHNSGALGF